MLTHRGVRPEQGIRSPASRLSSGVARHQCVAGARCVQEVVVNPETQAHVGIVHEAENSTTGYVLVLVHVAVFERHGSNATQQVNVDELASSGGTSYSVGEHVNVKQCEQ